jgi:hypothetical protein
MAEVLIPDVPDDVIANNEAQARAANMTLEQHLTELFVRHAVLTPFEQEAFTRLRQNALSEPADQPT